ncbi:MAG: hypothetical protein PHP03_00075 [Candidatus Pacebacteria bacterium]|nr:hypothetical protein [Candidatus Paceibacterota bacterium]
MEEQGAKAAKKTNVWIFVGVAVAILAIAAFVAMKYIAPKTPAVKQETVAISSAPASVAVAKSTAPAVSAKVKPQPKKKAAPQEAVAAKPEVKPKAEPKAEPPKETAKAPAKPENMIFEKMNDQVARAKSKLTAEEIQRWLCWMFKIPDSQKDAKVSLGWIREQNGIWGAKLMYDESGMAAKFPQKQKAKDFLIEYNTAFSEKQDEDFDKFVETVPGKAAGDVSMVAAMEKK